ncbi:hypothetical protein CCP3SC1AL1_1860005 [Gammaproteobacteria bacterium]
MICSAPMPSSQLRAALEKLQNAAYTTASENEFELTSISCTPAARCGYGHSEISEVLEAERCGNPPSVKLPGFSHVEEELADILLWVCIYAEGGKHRLAEAAEAKIEYWKTHPPRRP